MFDKLKDIWALKSKMEEMKKRLDAMVIKTVSPSGKIEIEINGSQEIKSVKLNAALEQTDAAELQTVMNKAIKESLSTAAQAMGALGGLPGLTPPAA